MHRVPEEGRVQEGEGPRGRWRRGRHDFEIVRRGEGLPSSGARGGGEDDDDSDWSDDSIDSDDTEALAHDMVLKKMFLRSKSKRALVDASYSKYAFHDDGLPAWFEQDEKRHLRPSVEDLIPEGELSEARDQLKSRSTRGRSRRWRRPRPGKKAVEEDGDGEGQGEPDRQLGGHQRQGQGQGDRQAVRAGQGPEEEARWGQGEEPEQRLAAAEERRTGSPWTAGCSRTRGR